MRSVVLLAAVLFPMTASAQTPAGDAAYCHRLADLYDRYIGRDAFSPGRAYGRSSLDGDVAAAQCRQGRPDQAIPVLERVLRGNGYSLPPRA